MKKNTLYNLLAAASISLLASCANNNDTVSISGTVSEGEGQLLALMHLSGSNPVLVDSVTLGKDGSFKFKPEVEKGGPDFFCLVCNGQTIPVVSDTLQTPIVLHADKERFASTYTVDDSLNTVLSQAVNQGREMRRLFLNLANQRQQGKVSDVVYIDSLQNMISTYKANMLQSYIYDNPASPVSYYLLFETLQGMQIFDPLDARDNRAFGAVANLWLNTYPNSPRTQYLEQCAREGMALRHQAMVEKQRADSLVQNAVIESANFIDLSLLGTKDALVNLSSVCGKGDVCLIDFTAYYISDVAVPHNEALSKVYEKYKDQGLKIYQICLDPDVNFWKVSAANLPWTVVRDTQLAFDENGMVAFSQAASTYNVSNIPTVFVMGRDGSPLTRVEDDSKLEAAVAKAM